MTDKGWQTHWHKHPAVRSGDQLTLGERAADRMRNVMGSWPFVFCFFGVMILWALVNTVVLHRVLHHAAFDPCPTSCSTSSSPCWPASRRRPS